MIDQRQRMDPSTFIAESRNNMALISQAQTKPDVLSRNSSSHPKLPVFGSRGTAMLKAALSESGKYNCQSVIPGNKLQLKSITLNESVRRKTPRNKVLFSEPVVTQQYEYEPTHLANQDQESDPAVCTDHETEQLLVARKNLSKRRFKSVDAFDCLGDIKINGITPIDIDDEENEVFTMASSEVLEEMPHIKRTPKKRPYNSIDDCELTTPAEYGPQKVATSSLNKQEGLFSSPKVAKIAPFYHDEPLASQSDLKNLRTNNQQTQSNATRSQRISLKLAILSGVRSSEQKHSENITFGTQRSVPELLSVRSIKHESKEMTVNETITNDSSNPTSYMNWFSNGLSFLSNQINKLIF